MKFLAEDAPALALSINPNAPIEQTDPGALYHQTQTGQAQRLIPLANCGKNLTRAPVVMLDFGQPKGRLILSQLTTSH